MKGFRYLQVFAPCPTGWRMAPEKTIEAAKLAVDTGMWTLFEYENGKFKINKRPKMTPVIDYIKIQGRFGHLTDEMVDELQKWANRKWETIQKMEDVEEE
jgi:pyruvate/2-oxoacid:ferredoxin oxidoreductase beta subunit